MKYFLSLCVLALLAIGVRAALPPWAADAVSGSFVEEALFRSMALPDGPVMHLRPPSESRQNLTSLLNRAPTPALHALRAHEEERAGDYRAAEADWKQATLPELADFYARRSEPGPEVTTLLREGATPASAEERFTAEAQQTQWLAFSRALTVAHEYLLPPAQQSLIYEGWIARYPKAAESYQSYLNWAVQSHDAEASARIAARLKSAFPADTQLAITTDAELAQVQNGSAAALAVYEKNFSPLWPESLRNQYWQALTNAHQLRSFLAAAQARSASTPDDLQPVTEVFFYDEQQNLKPAADAELLRFVARRQANHIAWTPTEATMLSALFQRVADYDESARFYYLLTALPAASARDKQAGLTGVISLLLQLPEQHLDFANGDLSLYKNIAGMDRHPGFLNGILTVALNTTSPEEQYANASQTAVAYFHRAAASRLLDKCRADFPASPRIPELEAELFSAYSLYGQDEAILRDIPAWLTRNFSQPQYVATALLLADAEQRNNKTADELALYDRLLQTLGDQSDHMPLGIAGARSPDYARVLDRDVSRLVALHRAPDALAILRREIDRNPDDAGLYERLALFVEQNHLDNDLEQTYKAALTRFQDSSWASKLARLYLRLHRNSSYEALAHQITDTFQGTELAAFFNQVPPKSPVLFRQVNLYAHHRFPHNTQFVINLLGAYTAQETADSKAYDTLLRENWFNDPGLQTLYFEYLTRDGKLRSEVAALPTAEQSQADGNVAALEFRAEAQSWLTEYESAAPGFISLAALQPGGGLSVQRAVTIERSLAPLVPAAFDTAVRLARQDVTASPSDRATAVQVGEILADRERFSQARIWWQRAASVRPGASNGYLDTAAVFWDYFQFGDALQTIREARTKLQNPYLFAYEAGAIDENESRYPDAIGQYVDAAMHESSEPARSRLLTLASRPATAAQVETQTAALVANGFDPEGFALRSAILERQHRRSELQALLSRFTPNASTVEEITALRDVSSRLGFDAITAQLLLRTVGITTDPIEKLDARLELARFYEAHANPAAAEQQYNSLLHDEPNRLGIVRAAVDYEWRTKQTTEAVQTLVAAAGRAQPPYQDQLKREAAEKATSSGQYTEARTLLDQLLRADRFNGDLLAEVAATYARAGDTAGLTKFYASALSSMTQAPLPAEDKTARVAALRRGYIFALSTAGQYSDALEQYQLVTNAYPEDANLTGEVSRYAQSHQLAPHVVAYYEKATNDSPHDYRWPLILARLQTAFGHYPEAVAAYDKAGYVRPDRSDMPTAKADLQMRLLRFTDVIQTYQKLYELSFHDRQYLLAQADAYARLDNRTEALRLLRAATIEGHPQDPDGFVQAMQHANTWHWFDVADALFREVRPLLSANPQWSAQALTAEIAALGPQHRIEDAANLVVASIDDPRQRSGLLTECAAAARDYLTPAEKADLAQKIEQPGTPQPPFATAEFARVAGLRDLQANLLLVQAKTPADRSTWRTLEQLQNSRLLFAQLGRELEQIAPSHRQTPPIYNQIEDQAFRAYTEAGDTSAQRRLINYSGSQFAALFLEAGGDLNRRLADLAAQNPGRANAVVQRLLATAKPGVVQAAIAARGRRLSPLWVNSYTALAALYLQPSVPWMKQSFAAVLGPGTVAGELDNRNDKNVLRGPNWFYYAGRYSEALDDNKDPEADDYRAEPLESAPAAASSYVSLGDTFADDRQWDRAIERYKNGLQLSPERADIYDRIAVVDVRSNHRAAAIEQWRQGLQLLTARIEAGPLPPEYWPSARALLIHTNHYRASTDLQAEIDGLLNTYVKRNQSYQLDPLLEGALTEAPDPRRALQRVLQLAQLPEGQGVLQVLLRSPTLVAATEKDALYQAELALQRKAASAAAGDEAVEARNQVRQMAAEYVRYLAQQARWIDAWSQLQQIQPPSERPADLVLKAGALTGHLPDLLKTYGQQPETTPAGEQILSAALALQTSHHPDLALQLEEFEYGRELQSGSAPASAYFGMARVRFAQKKNEEGLTLIRTVTLTVGAPFAHLPEAVSQLESLGLKSDAARYAAEWQKAEPWNDAARLASARLTADTEGANLIRRDREAGYALRVQAASLLAELHAPTDGADELALLTHGSVSVAEAEAEPLAVPVRLKAALSASAPGEKLKLYGEAIAIEPDLQRERWYLVDAAFAAHDDSLALAAWPSTSNNPGPNTVVYRRAIRSAAEAFGRRQEYAQAIGLYNRLLLDEADANRKLELTKARDELQARQKLLQINQQRRPVVTNAVTQRVIVKPKLAALPADEVASR